MGASEICFTTRDGAAVLKQRIEDYWSARGLRVQVVLVGAGFTQVLRGARFDLRSDMINGQPRTQSAATSAPSFL